MENVETIQGILKTITFHNPDNGYSVLKFRPTKPANSSKVFAVTGNFPQLGEGETLELCGTWINHPTYGEQFQAVSYSIITPEDKHSIETYLSSGILKGVGPAQAKLLVEYFGTSTFDVLDKEPKRLEEITQLGPKKIQNILVQWKAQKSIREVMYFLQSHQLSVNLCNKIYQHYGEGAVSILTANPYRLAEDIWGIGFLRADAIAQKMGFDQEGYERIQAGLVHVLQRSSEEGHIFLEKEQLIEQSAMLLECPQELLIYTLDNLVNDTQIHKDEENRYYRPFLYHSERGIANQLVQLLQSEGTGIEDSEIFQGIQDAEESFSNSFGSAFQYLDEQKKGIYKAIQSGAFILTGGPGTGKTTTLLGVLKVLKNNHKTLKLAAPTGRAAKRMSEVTQHSASTIHRLLKYDPQNGGFFHNEKVPLKTDVLIVDEFSMMDTSLTYSLLRAIEPSTQLIIVGDPDQLPSVGPGKVLSEFIVSKQIPHLHLSQIMRQAESSHIVLNAHRINQGLPPTFAQSNTNFYFRSCNSPDSARQKIIELVCKNLPEHFGYSPRTDIQVLTPMNRGNLGTLVLNQDLQKYLNSEKHGLSYKDLIFKRGDKVMQLKNNYEKNVFNGDIGYVQSVDASNKTISVSYDEENTVYEGETLSQLNLAYATTIHKSQGSEYKAIVLVLTSQHHVMLQRNLLYTAITRAKERVFIVGSMRAIERAVEHNPIVNRNTRLSILLREKLEQDLPF
jgi:exodeoxyribonuclease V alpha subunit